MANKRIRREIIINGTKRWITGATEQEYAESLIRALNMDAVARFTAEKHNFTTYAQKWFEVFAKPNISVVCATTYERQLRLHIFPAFDGMDIESIQPTDIQRMFNLMTDSAKESKIKVKNVLNMIFQQAQEDGLIQKNPLKSKSIRITGKASKETAPYSVEQMRFLVRGIDRLTNSADKMFLALHMLHPLRLEELLGLKWGDVDFETLSIHIRRATTHPTRNQPLVKETKTEASARMIALVPQILPYLKKGDADAFVLGGEKPLSYSQLRKMCERIQRETGFEESISPRRFRATVLTDIYDKTKDIKCTQASAGHTTATMTLKHYVKGRQAQNDTATPIAMAYGLTN